MREDRADGGEITHDAGKSCYGTSTAVLRR